MGREYRCRKVTGTFLEYSGLDKSERPYGKTHHPQNTRFCSPGTFPTYPHIFHADDDSPSIVVGKILNKIPNHPPTPSITAWAQVENVTPSST